jgi:RNA polymerase sigma factor (sigma-70 family)
MAEKMKGPFKGSEDLLPTRQSLLSRLKNWEDGDSWQEFFNRYWRLIYGVAIKSGLTEVEAQEVVQETIISVSKKIPAFKYDPALGSFKGWLLHMTRWRINDQLRKRQRESGPITRPSEQVGRTAVIERIPDPAASCLDTVWDQEWQNNLLEMAVEKVKRQVKPKQYQIFDLYVVKKWPMDKIVSTLGVNMGQIYLAKHRISALIKKEVKSLEAKLI